MELLSQVEAGGVPDALMSNSANCCRFKHVEELRRSVGDRHLLLSLHPSA